LREEERRSEGGKGRSQRVGKAEKEESQEAKKPEKDKDKARIPNTSVR
jgi:hypothetical protein